MLRIGALDVPDGELVVMAIVNRTPDSFYDRGATYAMAAALERVDQVVAEGADMVDVGGVKAAPGEEVDAAEEIRRTVDLVAAIRAAHPTLPISIDTWRAEVARGAGRRRRRRQRRLGRGGPRAGRGGRRGGAGLVCTHAGGLPPRTRPHRVAYDDVVADIVTRTTALAEAAVAAGVDRERVLIDPGHDFGKNTRHSLEATRRLGELVARAGRCWSRCRTRTSSARPSTSPGRAAHRHAGRDRCRAWLGARVFRAHESRPPGRRWTWSPPSAATGHRSHRPRPRLTPLPPTPR